MFSIDCRRPGECKGGKCRVAGKKQGSHHEVKHKILEVVIS